MTGNMIEIHRMSWWKVEFWRSAEKHDHSDLSVTIHASISIYIYHTGSDCGCRFKVGISECIADDNNRHDILEVSQTCGWTVLLIQPKKKYVSEKKWSTRLV